MDITSTYLERISAFIHGESFFYYHGLVLLNLWFFVALIAMVIRKYSIIAHAILFNIIDFTTAFFVIGAMLRVYPYISVRWDKWSLLKKGHFIGGGLFLILMIIQHIGGVSTLLQGIKFNPAHRKFAVLVTNTGRFLAFFGLIIGQAPEMYIYGSGTLAVILLILSVYNVFFKGVRPNVRERKSEGSSSRSKSPKRD